MKHKGNVRNILIDTVKKQKWLSSGILIAVLGAIGASLIPPLLLGKIVDSITAGHAVAFFVLCPLFCCACPDRFYGYGARESSDCFRTEDHACASKPSDGKVSQPQCRYDQSAGTGNDGIKVYRRCGHGREPVYFRNHQYVCGYV